MVFHCNHLFYSFHNVFEAKEERPQYKGISWDKQRKKWCASLYSKDGKRFGGYFNDELDAAKRVNQLCKEFGIAAKNPGISGAPNQQVTIKSISARCLIFAYREQLFMWLCLSESNLLLYLSPRLFRARSFNIWYQRKRIIFCVRNFCRPPEPLFPWPEISVWGASFWGK